MNALTESSARPQITSGSAVAGLIPTTIDEVFRLASAVHKAGLAPYGLDTPEKLTIAIMTGMEVGLPPMQAIQSIAVINNRPTMWGDGLIAVVRKSPECLYVKEWIDGEGDGMVAYCGTHRRGEPDPVVRSFSVEDAKAARLWQTEARVTKRSKSGGTYETDNDSPWYKYRKRMLSMRARAFCLRDVYADVLKGIQVREEVEDYAVRSEEIPRDVTPASDLRARFAAAPKARLPDAQGFDAGFVEAELVEATGGPETAADDAPEAGEPEAAVSEDKASVLAAFEAELTSRLDAGELVSPRDIKAVASTYGDRIDAAGCTAEAREIIARFKAELGGEVS